MTSLSSAEDVSTTTGMPRVRGSPLRRLRTSCPSSLGSFRSNRMSRGISAILLVALGSGPNRNSSASTPSRATWTLFARLAVLKACSVSLTSLGLSSTSRMSVCSSIMRRPLHGEVERCPSIDRRLGPNAPAVALDDALHDRQADAGAFEILRAMQPLKHAEKLVGILHVEADAVVANEEHLLLAVIA